MSRQDTTPVEFPGINWAAEPDLDEFHNSTKKLRVNPAAAISKLEELAELGSTMSMLQLAYIYGNDETVAYDYAKQEYWYKRASATDSQYANLSIGRFYASHSRYEEAAVEFEKGVAGAYAPSVYNLAKLYHFGYGVERNITKYKNYLIRATELGHLVAERELGLMMLSGRYGILDFFRGIALSTHACYNIRAVTRENPESIQLIH